MADTIRTQQDLLDNLFRDGQPANSISAQDVRDLIVSAPHLAEEVYGWEFVYDNTYTKDSRLTIGTGGWTQLTNDGARANLRYPSDFPGAWDTTNNKLKPAVLNGFGIIRLSFTALPQAANDQHFDIQIVTGTAGSPASFGSPLTAGQDWIYQDTRMFIKGTELQHFNFVIPLFVGSAFADSGAIFYLKSGGTQPFSVFDIAITAHRTFAPNPAA